MQISVDQWREKVENFNNLVASEFLHCTYDICSAYRKLTLVICSLFLAIFHSFAKFHSFRVHNILVSFLFLLIWYDFAAWSWPFLILLSGDIEINPGPKAVSGQSCFNFSLEFKQYFSAQSLQFFFLTADALVPNFDIICLSETNFNSER